MATLSATRPNLYLAVVSGFSAFESVVTNHNTCVGDATDTTYVACTTNATHDEAEAWDLQDMPTDFLSMDVVHWYLRYQHTASSTNTTANAYLRIMDSAGTTVLAAADSGGGWLTAANFFIFNLDLTVIPTDGTFFYVNTGATKAQWNGAQLQVRVVRNKTKGGDPMELRIIDVWIEGTYTTTRTPFISPYPQLLAH